MIDSAFVHIPPCHFQRADRLRTRPRFNSSVEKFENEKLEASLGASLGALEAVLTLRTDKTP
jgi:hypothetical protein